MRQSNFLWWRLPAILAMLLGFLAVAAQEVPTRSSGPSNENGPSKGSVDADAFVVGKVVRIADGDTLTILIDREQVKIRLDGIDTPERGQAFGNRAREFLADQCFSKFVHVRTKSKDRYGRVLGIVYTLEGANVNEQLVAQGLAWHYVQYSKDPRLAQLEQAARAARVGIWSEANPIPPWEWRKLEAARKRQQKNQP